MLHKNWANGRIGWYRPGVHRCAQVGTSLRECALVYAGVCGSAWVSTSVFGMNHILYEFLFIILERFDGTFRGHLRHR